MSTFNLRLRQYPHFDAPVSRARLMTLVSDTEKVAQNSFYPFLKYEKKWQPFRRKGAGPNKKGSFEPLPAKPAAKVRTIRYASHRDSAIFSYYRYLLSI